MKTVIKANRSVVVASAMATLAVAAIGFAGVAQARDNVYWSVGVGTPGAVVNVGNVGSVYQQLQPIYVQPQPVYVQPVPVYYQPQPVYVQPQVVYRAPQPVYYGHLHGRNKHHGNFYRRGDGQGYVPVPVYYHRSRHHDRHDD